jgi:hypothetical protein
MDTNSSHLDQNVNSVSPALSSKPATFSRFPDLPKEIQDHIWQFAVDGVDGRVVEIRQERYTSTCPIPALLRTCHDSRHWALKRWKLCFGSSFISPGRPAKIFFDYSSDTMFFGEYFEDMCAFKDHAFPAKGVQKVAFRIEQQWEYDHSVDVRVERIHGSFPDLQEIVFLNIDRDFDFDLADEDEPQPPRDQEKSIITFHEMALPSEEIFKHILTDFKEEYERKYGTYPSWRRLDFQYSYPVSQE